MNQEQEILKIVEGDSMEKFIKSNQRIGGQKQKNSTDQSRKNKNSKENGMTKSPTRSRTNQSNCNIETNLFQVVLKNTRKKRDSTYIRENKKDQEKVV